VGGLLQCRQAATHGWWVRSESSPFLLYHQLRCDTHIQQCDLVGCVFVVLRYEGIVVQLCAHHHHLCRVAKVQLREVQFSRDRLGKLVQATSPMPSYFMLHEHATYLIEQ